MHISSLTNIDNILVLDESTEGLEEGGKVEELRWDIKILIGGSRYLILLDILIEPIFSISGDLSWDGISIFLLLGKVDNLIVAGNLILWDDFHNHILIDIVSFIIEDNCNSEEIE